MSEPARAPEIDYSGFITEDDTPVDNFFQDKQCYLLADSLNASCPDRRPFICATDVGLFDRVDRPAVVPDVLLKLGAEFPTDLEHKSGRSYYVWLYGRPDLVVEIVSNRGGGEDTHKLQRYQEIGVIWYAIYDPTQQLSNRTLRVYQLTGATFVERIDRVFPELGLGLAIKPGTFDGMTGPWLRWTDVSGSVLETGLERAERESARADEELRRRLLLEQQLRDAGIEPPAWDS